MIIKVILFIGILVAGWLILTGKSSATRLAISRIATILLILAGIAAVIFPGVITTLANLIGVGRGADLVLYILSLAFLLVTVGMYRRMSELEDRCVALARSIALSEATHAAPVSTASERVESRFTTALLGSTEDR